MVCPFCYQVGLAAATYEVDELARHISKRHPKEGWVISIILSAVVAWAAPKVWRAITS